MIDYLPYLREQKFPHIWCPGCGHGIVMKAILRAVDKMGWQKDDVVLVSGIGCSSRMPGYVDFNTLHTTHGRALAFATGVKMANPRLHVVVVSGDGDATAIGGNHFIHAARRNIDMTLVVMNNYIYGMTGGQVSPTTPLGKKASTAPYGNLERPFDIAGLAAAAGATFVARGTAYNAIQLGRFVERALAKKGFAVVEAMSPCPTVYGRRNRYRRGAVELLEELRDQAVSQQEAAKLSPEERAGKIVTGVLVDEERPEYLETYQQMVESLRA